MTRGRLLNQLDLEGENGPYEKTITRGDQNRTFEDILIGGLWLASGQCH